MGNAVVANIVVLNETESGAWDLSLDKLSSGVDIVRSLGERGAVKAVFGNSGVDVLAQSWETESVDVDSAALQAVSGLGSRVATDVRRRGQDAGEKKAQHLSEGLGLKSRSSD